MIRGREMFESRASLVAGALMACSCLPVLAGAQDTAPRTVGVREPRRAVAVREPSGWFGVRISDQALVDENGNAFFDSYPVVTSVNPDSPAEKAGVRAGDVLLNFNSIDMRGGSVELAKWLKVGAPFILKIRRNDETKILKGRLARRPDDWEQRVELSMTQALDLRQRSLSREPSRSTVNVRTRLPAPQPLLTILPPALGFGGGVYPFAGAEFMELNPDLSDVLGVGPEGVFVTNVLEASPARNAGLRGGDIVLKADGAKVNGPIDLVRAIKVADQGDRSVDLQILRKHQLLALTLRW